tara:strand:+ start:15542 stop:16363 length:822 start_codon:yes stop_codon:yes gene_type:complete
MATISKAGIQEGLTSKAEHLTRIIDALDGTATTEVVATGSFTGSFDGLVTSASFAVTASYADNAGAGAGFPFSGNAEISGSLLISSSASETPLTVSGSDSTRAALTVNNGYIEGTTRTTKDTVYLDNSSTISGTFEAKGIKSGMTAFINLSLSGTNSVQLELPRTSGLSVGHNYQIIIAGSAGSIDAFGNKGSLLRLSKNSSNGAILNGLVTGNKTSGAGSDTTLTIGGNVIRATGSIGDRYDITLMRTGSSDLAMEWIIHAHVSCSGHVGIS